ncbi:hypothetical protein GIB67_042920 [Kingdonia uniflora]|uniref:Exportin-1/Importin-beta-like domain-containing protein n=1 Tax=Kingdonia uniflora TaxID=39325 RepID=A0A7J7P3D3_9MAGN|nr:hypothetical protein GIB67_042920 [Kingdonia uniflora]
MFWNGNRNIDGISLKIIEFEAQVNDDDHEMLIGEVSEMEIFEALQDIDNFKAAGPNDSLSAGAINESLNNFNTITGLEVNTNKSACYFSRVETNVKEDCDYYGVQGEGLHLVRLRWEELTLVERRNFDKIAIELLSEMSNPCEEWALKSQTAALIAEIVKREGITLLQDLLPSLVSLSNMGPTQAELVSMVLRWLPEDITVHNEDLEGFHWPK